MPIVLGHILSHPSWVCGLKQPLCGCRACEFLSHPSWVCGLKQMEQPKQRRRVVVTPFVGVWIETFVSRSTSSAAASHPSWVCGLKLASALSFLVGAMSHPSWVCGLKQKEASIKAQYNESHPSWVCGLKQLRCLAYYVIAHVTPFVGVWIETTSKMCHLKYTPSHTLRGCVD